MEQKKSRDDCEVPGCDKSAAKTDWIERTSPKGGPFQGRCPEHYAALKAQMLNDASACTPSEREFLDWLYKEHDELDGESDLIADFPGWYADWNEVIDAMPDDIRNGGYAQSPIELIRRLIDQRDELRSKLTGRIGG